MTGQKRRRWWAPTPSESHNVVERLEKVARDLESVAQDLRGQIEESGRQEGPAQDDREADKE